MKETIENESARKSVEGQPEPNGSIEPINRPAEGAFAPLEVDTDLAMEVDEDYLESAEPITRWRRGHADGRSMYPPVLPHLNSSRPFDTLSVGSTRSLYDSDLDYYIENNRRYVSTYTQPNDEEEQLRMQIMHQVFLFLLKSELTSIPLSRPERILDIGTGTGDWVIGIGEAFPEAEVIGTDLSAIQPSAVPPNVFFEIFDAEDDEWTYPQDNFDLIHFRNVAGSFQSWGEMYKRAHAHLKPGGWIEVVDFDDQSSMFSKYFTKGTEMHAWYQAVAEASVRSGKDMGPAHLKTERLSEAGFVDVKVTDHELPIGVWPSDPDDRSTAKLWLIVCLEGVEAVSLRLLTRDMGWEPEKVIEMCRKVEKDLKALAMDKDRAQGLSASVKILVGRKPFVGGETGREHDEHEIGIAVDDEQPEGKRIKIGENA